MMMMWWMAVHPGLLDVRVWLPPLLETLVCVCFREPPKYYKKTCFLFGKRHSMSCLVFLPSSRWTSWTSLILFFSLEWINQGIAPKGNGRPSLRIVMIEYLPTLQEFVGTGKTRSSTSRKPTTQLSVLAVILGGPTTTRVPMPSWE